MRSDEREPAHPSVSRRRKLVVRTVMLALIAFVLALAVVLVIQRLASRLDHRAPDPRARESPVSFIAPGPLPKGSILVGAAEKDGDGYPRQQVDQRALRSLLWHGRYAELDRFIEELQAAFERDWHKEYWPIDAGDAFASAEPELREQLDRWVAATPDAFSPYLARGAHWVAVGYARRGGDTADKTSGAEFRSMADAFREAAKDILRAQALRPGLVAAHRLTIQLALASSQDKLAEQAIRSALKLCPTCFQVRVTFLVSLKPRWGGSYERMMSFAKEAPIRENSLLRVLPGFIYADQADQLLRQRKLHEALVMIERACSLGDHWLFLMERARVKIQLDDFVGALADLDDSLLLRRDNPRALFLRAWLHRNKKRYAEAGVDFLAALQLRPTDPMARRGLEPTVQGLVFAGWEQHRLGQRRQAIDLLDLAMALAPDNQEANRRRFAMIMDGRGISDEDLARLQAEAMEAPDDFRIHQRLDYALAKRRRFHEVIALWKAFLARHPDHGRALLERSGAFYHLERFEDALVDARSSCALGLSEGCYFSAMLQRHILR